MTGPRLAGSLAWPFEINLCVVWGDCPCAQPCPVGGSLARVQHMLEHELGAVTIADLAGQLPQDRCGGMPDDVASLRSP